MKVYKGNLVPIWNENNKIFTKVSEFEEEEIRKKWNKLLEYLRKYLWLIVKIYNKNLSKLGKSISMEDVKPLKDLDLSIIADAIAMFFKAPLYKEVFRRLYLSPFKILIIFLASKNIIEDLNKDERSRVDIFDIEALFNSEIINRLMNDKDISDLINLLDNDELFKLLLDCYSIPSDTRPGANTSSLIVHLLSSSALVWPLLGDVTDLHIFRIASLLHDIGKPLDYEKHVNVSVREARKLLEGLISDKDLEKILKRIKSHHEKGSIIGRADVKSSSTDRLKKLIRKTIGEDIKKLVLEIAGEIGEDSIEWAYSGGKEIWDFWKKVEEKHPGKIRELTMKFVEKINEIQSRKVLKKEMKEPEVVDRNILFVKMDLRGIQRYIRSTISLKAVSGASLLIEMLIHYLVPLKLIYEGFPYESILYSGGGNIVALIPLSKVDRLKECIRKTLTGVFGGLGYEIGYFNFTEDFYMMNLRTELDLIFRKVVARRREDVFRSLGMEDRCQFCNLNPSISIISIGDRRYRVCNLCERKYDFGTNLSMRNKWYKIEVNNEVAAKVFGKDFSKVSGKLMEVISGMEIEKPEERILNYSLISIDGNLVGYFMAKSISLTDMIERSYRCEMALKLSYNYALKKLLEVIPGNGGRKTVFRILLGTVYLGGDDGLMIVPSWISIPFSIMLGEEFYKNIGGETGLSIGIFTVNAKYPIWLALKNSKKLLEYCKKEWGRKMDDGKLIAKGVISFYISEKGNISPGTIEEYVKSVRDERYLSVQPYLLNIDYKGKPLQNSIYYLLHKVGILERVDEENKYEKMIAKTYEFYNTLKSKKDEHEFRKLFRRIRDTLVYYDKVLNEVSGNLNAVRMVLVFLMRNYCRFSGKNDELSRRYLNILKMMDLYNLKNNLLLDSALLLKTMGGGYL